MTKEEVLVKSPLAVVMTFVTYLMGSFSELFVVLIAIMVLDYGTGILRGLITHTLSATIGLVGLFKKVTMLVVIGLAACVQFVLATVGIDTSNLLVVTVISFFIVNEGISVLENSAQIGVPMPAIIYTALEKIRDLGGKAHVVEKVVHNVEVAVQVQVPPPVQVSEADPEPVTVTVEQTKEKTKEE